jgi:hypothetical protein
MRARALDLLGHLLAGDARLRSAARTARRGGGFLPSTRSSVIFSRSGFRFCSTEGVLPQAAQLVGDVLEARARVG